MDDFLDNSKNLEGALRFLDHRPKDQPFALSVCFNLPHNAGTSSMQLKDGDKRIEEKAFYYTEYTLKTNRSKTIDIGGYFLYKHFDVQANLLSASSDLNWSLYRYAELLLDYAETSNEISGPTTLAYEGVNAIRIRAGLTPHVSLSKDEFREAVWREKWHELSYETVTWFDMIRVRKGFDVSNGTFDEFVGHQFAYGPTLSARELLFPIPTSEMRNNPKLEQNAGY